MALKVVVSPLYEDLRDRERCAMCGALTEYWYVPKDVAMCPSCAQHTRRADVPSKEEWWNLSTKRRFNGKPHAHWEREAKKLVVEQLVRSSMVDSRSIIGALASKRLIELAYEEDPDLVREVVEERNRCIAGMNKVLAEILSP